MKHEKFLIFAIFLAPVQLTAIRHVDAGETMTGIDLRECFERNHLVKGFSGNLYAEPSVENLKWCLRAFTNRNASDAGELIGITSWVEYSWYRLDDGDSKITKSSIPCVHGNNEEYNRVDFLTPRCRDVRSTCVVALDGFKGEYQLSPDFGGYPGCSRTIERYFFELHRRTSLKNSTNFMNKQRYDAPSRRGCPLKRLPFSIDDFNACTLSPNSWYVLNFRSYSRWESENGTVLEAVGAEKIVLLRTYDRKDDVYVTHTQIKGCLLRTIILMKHKLPFPLIIHVDIHVKNHENDVRHVFKEDTHEVGTDLVGKEFTYQLPNGSRIVRYCQKVEAQLDPEFRLSLPNVTRLCIARTITTCPKMEPLSSGSGWMTKENVIFMFCFALSLLIDVRKNRVQ